MKAAFELKYKFTRKIWKKLNDSVVPIVDAKGLNPAATKSKILEINSLLRSSQYFPETSHGFLGINKGNGVTRFIPIMSAVDMAVYYYICYALSGKILDKLEGVYGGWQIVPDAVNSKKSAPTLEEIDGYLQDYFSDSVSKQKWWKDWTRFVEMIRHLTSQKEIGNFVLSSDIANFYDSISTDHLIRKLRKKTKDFGDHIDVLEVFLGYWNRRITGYTPSTKGIPQELFSDASRVLSHFYLQNFDEKFKSECGARGVVYSRWADDILLLGSSKAKLEDCLHRASKLLLADGLHLSSGKTKIMSRSQYRKYRCVNFLEAVNSKNIKKFETSLRKHEKDFDAEAIRIDTLLKTTIGHAMKNRHLISSYTKLFIDRAVRDKVDISLSLNQQQLFNVIFLNPSPKEMFDLLLRRNLSKPFASSRATFLLMIRKKTKELNALGLTNKKLVAAIERIEKKSADSDILMKHCIPVAKSEVVKK